MTANLFRALEDAYSTGVDRILTSGGESTSLVGSHTIAQLVNKAAERVVIMPGSGIKTDNAAQLVRAGMMSAVSNRKALRVAEEPLTIFRRYMATYARQQSRCLYDQKLIDNLEHSWKPDTRRM